MQNLLSGLSSGSSRPTRLDLLRCHRQCAESFAALCHGEPDDSSDLPPLYRLEGGRELRRFCDTLESHWKENTRAEDAQAEDIQDYLPTLEALLAAETRGGEYATHPRLAILGALEARLLSFDLLVLGSMTEGSWPGEPDKSPFLPESLRAKVGLKPLEHNIGLSALDFVNFASAPMRVLITHAARDKGQPQQASRFVQRLQACQPCRNPAFEAERRAWLAQLLSERAAGAETLTTVSALSALSAPAPKAPQTARPLRVSLTSLATLHEDPYTLYARQVLRLVPLEPLLANNEPALYGSCLHACFEEILQGYKKQTFKKKTSAHDKEQPATEILESIVARQLARFAPSRFAEAFWKEPLLRSAKHLLGNMKGLNPRRLWCEVAGEYRIALENGRNLTMSARADLVVESQDGSWWLIDHKTGALPSRTSLGNLEQPQLVLGAWLLQQGAFQAEGKRLRPATLPQSCYWRFSGRRDGGGLRMIDEQVWAKKTTEQGQAFETAQAFAEACFAHYAALLQHFDCEETPYPAHALSLQRATYDPYRHLARRQAWSWNAD